MGKKGKIAPPTLEEYRDKAIAMAFGWAPKIYGCKKCGWPVISGYCCRTCGDFEPDKAPEKPNN